MAGVAIISHHSHTRTHHSCCQHALRGNCDVTIASLAACICARRASIAMGLRDVKKVIHVLLLHEGEAQQTPLDLPNHQFCCITRFTTHMHHMLSEELIHCKARPMVRLKVGQCTSPVPEGGRYPWGAAVPPCVGGSRIILWHSSKVLLCSPLWGGPGRESQTCLIDCCVNISFIAASISAFRFASGANEVVIVCSISC